MQKHQTKKSSKAKVKKQSSGSLYAMLAVIETIRPDLAVTIQSLRHNLNNDDVDTINKMYNRKLYPEQEVYYAQVRNHDNCKAKTSLNVYESAILHLLISCMSQSGYVSVPVPVICDELAIKSPKTVRKAIQTLLKRDLIRVYRQSTRHESIIYMINPLVANSGKNFKAALDYKTEQYKKLPEYEISETINKTVRKSAYIKIATDETDERLTYGTLVDTQQSISKDEEKELISQQQIPIPTKEDHQDSDIPDGLDTNVDTTDIDELFIKQ